MDLTALQKKVIWIPTPGQPEQVYLARHLCQNFHQKYIEQKQTGWLHKIILDLKKEVEE
jgi:hypothetical protein